MEPVLRCARCNKPFDKESSLKRHGYYCRSRRLASTTRPRSCIACAKRKTRCDNKRPGCWTCSTRGIECQYPGNTRGIGRNVQQHEKVLTEGMRVSSLPVADLEMVENSPEARNTNLVMSYQASTSLGVESLEYDLDFADFLNPLMNDTMIENSLSGSSSIVTQSTRFTDETHQARQAVLPAYASIPINPTNVLRSFVQRPKVKMSAQRTTHLILQTLKSYPSMMMRNNTLPPFIHPRLVSFDIENTNLEPLTNCMSLVHMISSGIPGSRKLFWKNVRMECERWCAEPCKLNKWELLAAMQALSIYVIIRLDEGETSHNNFDYLLVATIKIVAQQLASSDIISGPQHEPDNNDLEINWKNWIFEESRRRLCLIYKVVNMLVYFEPAAMCTMQTEFILAPLPAKKQLWEAADEFVWNTESETESGVPTAFGMIANGEIVKLDEGPFPCTHDALLRKPFDTRNPPRSTAKWEDWCSGMDGFGGLVMLVASLIGQR